MTRLPPLLPAPATARDDAVPRIDPRADAEGARVISDEVGAADHPRVRILATVLRGGAPLTGLGARDFRVREDELDREPPTVEPRPPPLSVGLAIDASGSMSERMVEPRAAATGLAERLGDDAAAQVPRFARDIEATAPMTKTKPEVTAAIATFAARGDTALFDALARPVERVEERPDREAIVVLSDGADDDGTGRAPSEAAIDDVLSEAAEVEVPIFAEGLGAEMDAVALTRICEETGAVHLDASEASELRAVYERIGEQFSGQHSIAHTSSPPADGTARRVDLEARDGRNGKANAPEGGAVAAEPASETPHECLVGATTERDFHDCDLMQRDACARGTSFHGVIGRAEIFGRAHDAGMIDTVRRDAIRAGA